MNKQQLIELTEEIKHSSIPKPSQKILLELVDKVALLEHLEVFDKLYLEKCEEVNKLNAELKVCNTLKVGDKVIMNRKYWVADQNVGRIFTVIKEPQEVSGTLVVCLEGYSGCYAVDGLIKV